VKHGGRRCARLRTVEPNQREHATSDVGYRLTEMRPLERDDLDRGVPGSKFATLVAGSRKEWLVVASPLKAPFPVDWRRHALWPGGASPPISRLTLPCLSGDRGVSPLRRALRTGEIEVGPAPSPRSISFFLQLCFSFDLH